MRKIIRKIQVVLSTCAYLILATSPALADDTEIYLGGGSSGEAGGHANVLMLLDNSGSMEDAMGGELRVLAAST